MRQCILGRDTPLGVELQELLDQVDPRVAQGAGEPTDLERRPHGEIFVPVLVAGHAWPDVLVGGTQDAEDLEELVDLRVAGEQRSLGGHFCEDRADCPHVHGQRVGLAAEEDLRWAVP